MFAAQMIITSFIIYMATFFQHVLGYGPLLASLALAPAVVTQPVFSVLAGRLTDRIGARAPGPLRLPARRRRSRLDRRSSSTTTATRCCCRACSLLGPSIAPMFTSLLTDLSNEVAAEERGDANALVLTVRWIGAAAGTMVLGVVIHSGEGPVPGRRPLRHRLRHPRRACALGRRARLRPAVVLRRVRDRA